MKFESSHLAYNDTIDSLKNEYKEDKSNSVIICGAHDFSRVGKDVTYFRKKYPGAKIIAFNQEPLLATQREFMTPNYFIFLKESDEVWDYDEQNLSVIRKFIPEAKLHILKAYKKWPIEHKKDIDILFYGAINGHRKKLLDVLCKKYKVKVLTNTYDLDNYILRSKVLLNIHYYYECGMQEQARMVRWLGAPCRIISEKSKINYLNVEEMTYEEMFKI